MTTGSSTLIDLSSIDRPCSAERTSDERQAGELVEKNQETDQAPADSNPVRRRSGRFVVESVMQHVRVFSSSRSRDASYTADDDDDMWLEREQSPTLPPLHQRFLSRTAMSKRQSRLKSILKNARSVSFCQPSSNETSPPPISTRHKRVSFSEIVTKQLYKSDESQTESRRGKDKQKKKNKNQSDFPSRKARQTPPSKNGRPLNEQRKQPDLLLESLSSFFSLSSKKEDCEDVTDEFIEVEDKSIEEEEEDQSIIDDDKSIAEDDEWNEVTHRRRRNFKHGGGSPLKRCDSELSDESGFGSLPSSFDEENCAINKLCDDAVFSSIEKTDYEEEEDESSMPLPSHQKDKYQDVNRLIQQMLSCAVSSDGESVPVVND